MDEARETMARTISAATHVMNKAVGQLLGIVTGVVADGELTDKEIVFLKTWLTEHAAVADEWPGSAIYRAVSDVLADGVITEVERQHLTDVLQQLVRTDFAQTGSALPDGPMLPIDDIVTVELVNAGVCHTGEFMFGTRAAVERATLKAGGLPVDNVTRRTDLLVIGARLSPTWAQTTYGRKIQKAKELQEAGTGIEIISERRWIEALEAAAGRG